MATDGENIVVAVLQKINALLGKGRWNLPGVSQRGQERWLTGKIPPPASGAREVAWALWDQIHGPGQEVTRQEVFRCLREVVPSAPGQWTRATFGAWFFEQADAARAGVPRSPDQFPWTMPTRQWHPTDPPGYILRAEAGVVPFHFREDDLDDLRGWCGTHELHRCKVRLYLGAGGMGKTRLALQLCEEKLKEKWRAGFLNYHRVKEGGVDWAGLLQDRSPLLLVCDYAQHHRDELRAVLSALAKDEPPCKRVMLLARDAGGWWTNLKIETAPGRLLGNEQEVVHRLKPVAPVSNQAARQESFAKAAAAFATALGQEIPVVPKRSLQAPYYDRVLLLHMDALATIEGAQVEGEDGIRDYILNREQRFWAEGLKAHGLPERLLEGIWQTMSAVTYAQGITTRDDGLELLRVLPFFEGQTVDVLHAVNHMLHETYPGDHHWIPPVQPDPLGERLIERAFAGSDYLRKTVFRAAAQTARVRAKNART